MTLNEPCDCKIDNTVAIYGFKCVIIHDGHSPKGGHYTCAKKKQKD